MLGLKNKRNSQRNEVIGIVMLTLLVILFSWLWLPTKKSHGLTGRHPLANTRELQSKNAYGHTLWWMNVKYRPDSGMLLVMLSHKYNAPTKGLRLVAHFTSDDDRPAVLTLLQSRSNGNYRSDNLHLDSGEWVMNVTGRRWSELVFMLEQPLLVR